MDAARHPQRRPGISVEQSSSSMLRRSPDRICSSAVVQKVAPRSASVTAQTNQHRWGDAYLEWGDGEPGQARPSPDIGGGSPADRTTSLAEGKGQPHTWMAGVGIADENTFGINYWMLDVDMDCEQAFDDRQGHQWFELKAFTVTSLITAIAPSPGWDSLRPALRYRRISPGIIWAYAGWSMCSWPTFPIGLLTRMRMRHSFQAELRCTSHRGTIAPLRPRS
jgi:hypothetical protein